jgi:hypothetical protein
MTGGIRGCRLFCLERRSPSRLVDAAAASWAVSRLVATTSKTRLQATSSRMTPDRLTAIRRRIAIAIAIGV